MINPLSARILLPQNTILSTPISRSKANVGNSRDTFTSSANKNSAPKTEVKSGDTILELLFGNIIKKYRTQETKPYNKYEAELYAKPSNEEELKQFFENYEPPIKW